MREPVNYLELLKSGRPQAQNGREKPSGPIWDPGAPLVGDSVPQISAYAQKALAEETSIMLAATPGIRNRTLNVCGFKLGQLIGARTLVRADVEDQLRAAALHVGLGPAEIEATLASSLGAGERQPRQIVLRTERGRSPQVLEVAPEELIGEADPTDVVGSSWLPLDLAGTVEGLLAGTLIRPAPMIGRLPDGDALFYPGRVNGIHGDSTSGKTWTALAVAREQIGDGERVLYVDLEDNEAGMVGRLLEMGLAAEAILDRFSYVRPYDPCDAVALGLLLGTVEQIRPSLAIIDTTGEALALQGANPNADEEVATWMRRVARRIADLGPAVVLLDHIPKNHDGTTPLQPIGSQRKRAAISGAQYAQDCREPFSRDEDGLSRLRCGKDRGGYFATGQHVADLRIGPSTIGVAQLETPADATSFRPTVLMARISDWLTSNQGASKTAIETGVRGNSASKRAALRILCNEGHVVVEQRGQTFAHTLVRPYFTNTDEGSE